MQLLHGSNHITKACEAFPCGAKPFLISLLAVLFIFVFSFYPPKQISLGSAAQSLSLHAFSDIGGDEAGCDLYNGSWVRDSQGPLYTNTTCQTLPETKNCAKYGKAMDYLNWRWKPHGCELPRFDSERFLHIVVGKKLAFVGDSVARNHMESLLCLLSQAETPINVQREAKDRFVTWQFRSHNFTLAVLWTKFLVAATERPVNGSAAQAYDIHLDEPDTKWTKKSTLEQTDIVVLSASQWFFRTNYLYDGGKLVGCTYCSEPGVVDLGVAFAIRRVFRTALQFLNTCDKCQWRVTIVRTISPTHFENGAWNGGGYCNRTEPASDQGVASSGWGDMALSVQAEEAARVRERQAKSERKVEVMDVTAAMAMRPDGHPGLHLNRKWMRGRSDCLHWCMPGPVDTWNELLLAVLSNAG